MIVVPVFRSISFILSHFEGGTSMHSSAQTSDAESVQTTSNITGKNLWDEILKAVFLTKPQQLFHLFKEVYGKEYPPDTSIQFISTEYSTFLD